jgi:hypothetical protein
MRGEISLLGADVSIFEQTQLHLTLLQGDRKTIFHLRAHDNKEASYEPCNLTSFSHRDDTHRQTHGTFL